jgi:hypothetical protein
VTIVILGASVAENSGCLSQPGKRCMGNRGVEPVRMVWGEPRVRPFKGFAVRLFEWINATWPHPQHQLFNAGRDASSLLTMVPCLFSHLPPTFDLVLVEGGSMFETTRGYTLELLVRQLVSMRIPPVVAFVTVHLWCTFGGSHKKTPSYGLSRLPPRVYSFWSGKRPRVASSSGHTVASHVEKGAIKAIGTSDKLEKQINDICRHYGLSCISQRDALMPTIDKLAIDEVAGDCLHPAHGSKGTEFITDLLVHWLMRSIERLRATRRTSPALLLPRAPLDGHLPPPIHDKQVRANDNQKAACFSLLEGMGRSHAITALPWHTAACPAARSGTALSFGSDLSQSLQAAGCAHVDELPECPSSYHQPLLGRIGAPPPVWMFCEKSVSVSKDQAPKPSPAVVAFQPGATLMVPLPTAWLTSSSDSLSVSFNVTLQYTVSWRAMGVVRIACTDSCVCQTHDLDGHAAFQTRNSTVFTEHQFLASLRHQARIERCGPLPFEYQAVPTPSAR